MNRGYRYLEPEALARVKNLALVARGVVEGAISGIHASPYKGFSVEFAAEPGSFRYLDVQDDWQELQLPAKAVAFTWCQVPVVYRLQDTTEPVMELTYSDGMTQPLPTLSLSESMSAELFLRSGVYRKYAEQFLAPDQLEDLDITKYLTAA